MKILFVFNNIYFFRYLDGVVRSLRAKGHDVVVAANFTRLSEGYTDRALQNCIKESGCQTEPIILPRGYSMIGAVLRDIIGYANYFRPGHPSPTWAARWKRFLPPIAQSFINFPLTKRLVRSHIMRNILRTIERRLVPDSRVVRRLKSDPPDVLVACPFIWTLSADVDYVKAAARMNIPTVVAVGSWDHLAGKGIFPLIPDVTLVWNEEMALEGIGIQDIPADRIVVTGAPSFDFWFEAEPTVERTSFVEQVGLNDDKPYIIYLCSSKPIAGENEPRVVKELSEVLKRNNGTKAIQILVRPYPSRAYLWRGFDIPNVSVWPREGEWPDTDQARQNLFNSIYHSMAVVGINTTAMLEASVISKPCLAIMTQEFRGSQVERAHFQQILRGGFLETAGSFIEVQRLLDGLLDGIDKKETIRKEFVRSFLRPRGFQNCVAELAASAVEMTAKHKSAIEISKYIGDKYSVISNSNQVSTG